MIDAFHPDYALWKKASQLREVCEKQENQLKRKRNVLAALVVLTIAAVVTFLLALPKELMMQNASTALSRYLPTAEIVLIVAGLFFLTALIYTVVKIRMAQDKTEDARKKEYRIIIGLYKGIYSAPK